MNRGALGGILGVLLAVSIGGNVWLYLSNSKSAKATKDVADVSVLKDSLMQQVAKLDSMQNLLAGTQTERQNLADKVDELESGGDANLKTQIADLQNKIAYYQNMASQSGAAVQSAASDGKITRKEAGKIAKIKAELEEKLKEIEALNAQIATLTAERNTAIAERDIALGDKSRLDAENNGLKEKVKYGAVPLYGSFIAIGISHKNNAVVESYKLKGLEKFKLTFDLLENEMVSKDMPVSEEVTIRILGPAGEVLSTENKNMEDVDKVYSLKHTITFNGEKQKVELSYPKSGKLDVKLRKGRYSAELWSRGKLQQKNIFDLM
ncbi:MAG: hypothetical protein KG003_03730 [Bacteroidetes bacterium]|nr:hypothetical protein [Bacteroidota bacterium]